MAKANASSGNNPKRDAAKRSGPVFIVKPVSNKFGIDYLHITLILLVLVLIALAISLSNFKPTTIVKTCQYGVVNGTCSQPKYTSTNAIDAAEHVLADYAVINSTLSLLPYYSLVNDSKAEYLVNSSMWLVIVPYINPFTKEVLNVSMLLYGSNLSLATPYMQMIRPLVNSSNYVVAPGTVAMTGKAACTYNTSMPVFLITDPYAPGALASISKAINTSKLMDPKINMSYKFIFSDYSIALYKSYGVAETQDLGDYLACTSQQSKFKDFISNLTNIYSGNPISNYTLYQLAIGSGLNASMLNTCMENVSTALDYQAKLAQYYNITSTPIFVVDCKYLSIPETLNKSIAYALNASKSIASSR
jgi:hypothetical protein